jgi:hypothetical protein
VLLTITGAHLAGATAVSFGSARGTNVSVSNTQITATVPAGRAGTVDIRVTTPAGTSAATRADRYTFVAPPPVIPAVTNLRVTRSRFHAAGRGGSIGTTGATVRFTLSERATVAFAVEQPRTGRRLRRTFTFAGRSGANGFTFTGRLGGAKLPPGAYRLVATATDATGRHSRPARVGFRIVAG